MIPCLKDATTDTSEKSSLHEKMVHYYREGLREDLGADNTLHQVLAYTLNNPGGLVRAKLAYSLCRSFGLNEEASANSAIAVEYFQTASLLFDDLPSMDNASERRGGITSHRLFGESKTTLASLALINKAYALMAKFISRGPIQEQGQAQACLYSCLGLGGLIGGQADDLYHTISTGKQALHVANKKTRPLLRMAMVIPATVGGADQRMVQQIRRLSLFWGLAYQISDDMKDVLSDNQEIGKPANQDATLGRPNFVLCEGIIPAIKQLKHYVDLSRRIIHQYPKSHPSKAILKEMQQWFEGVVTKWSEKISKL